MNCPYCSQELAWIGDHDLMDMVDEDYVDEVEGGVLSIYTCNRDTCTVKTVEITHM